MNVKNRTIFKVFLLFCVCNMAFGEMIEPVSVQHQAIMDAERDAKREDTGLWALTGCGFGIWGIAAAQVITPAVPPTKLLGKSPEYIAFYTETYQRVVKKDRTTRASFGCLFSGLSLCIFYTLFYPDMVQPKYPLY